MAIQIQKEDLLRLLELAKSDKLASFERRTVIKNWAITIWIGLLVFLNTEFEGDLSDIKKISIMVAPIILFWLVEGIYLGIEEFINKYILKIERILSNKEEVSNDSTLYFNHFRKSLSIREKIKLYLNCLFTKETCFIFYLLLTFLSFIILFVI